MTMEKFEAGQKFEQEIEVTLEHTTNRMGKPGADVLSTPASAGVDGRRMHTAVGAVYAGLSIRPWGTRWTGLTAPCADTCG